MRHFNFDSGSVVGPSPLYLAGGNFVESAHNDHLHNMDTSSTAQSNGEQGVLHDQQSNQQQQSAQQHEVAHQDQQFPDHSMDSIRSLLAASQQLATPNHQHVPWTPDAVAAAVADSSKRKRGDSPSEDDARNKMRKTGTQAIPHHFHPPQALPYMTTVTCLHAAVAQKSYGNEKRFLCPPPVVRIDTPITQNHRYRAQQLSMRIFPEISERDVGNPPEQRAALDDMMQACFKYLHVGGSAKSKSFHLSLEIADPPVFESRLSQSEHGESEQLPIPKMVKLPRVWASFNSAPVTIISKPSKKTAKTRNLASCILAGGPVSLFNRINSQTVRTKYMTVDQGRLCASNTTWSAFNVEVVQAVTDPNSAQDLASQFHPGAAPPQPVTYGSTLLLTDSHTGLTSDPLIIRKVDKGRIVMDEGTMGGPVSQMQKVALCRITETGARYYLSAAGPLQILPDPNAPQGPDGKGHVIATHPLVYQPPAIREEMKNDVRVEVDEVDDFLCWTIVGISKFQYTFFDGIHNTSFPTFPITPFPTLLSTPMYKPATHTLDLTLSNFFYMDPNEMTGVSHPLEIWLGTLGPLNARVYQGGTLTHTIGPNPAAGPSNAMAHPNGPAQPLPRQFVHVVSPNSGQPEPAPPIPAALLGQVIVVVEMPPVHDVLKMVEMMTGIDYTLGGPLHGMTAMEPAETSGEPTNGAGAGENGDDAEGKGKGKADDAAASSAPTSDAQNGTNGTTPRPQSLDPNNPTAVPAHLIPHPGAAGGLYPPGHPHAHIAMPMPSITRGVPLLFVRSADGIGYHSGREMACENMLAPMGTVPGPDLQGWTLRVI
ncbi:hypothetical protein FRC02_001400 [Tulasnella sp. 418]|nr:hypothetical protein FRC02_001400 [Tulasnella sp. 418]